MLHLDTAEKQLDLLDRIDDVIADVCHQCGDPLGASVSEWFCDEDCQSAWTAHHVDVERLTGYREPTGGWSDDRYCTGGRGAFDDDEHAVGYNPSLRPPPLTNGMPRLPVRLPEGAFAYSFPRWPDRHEMGSDHTSEVEGYGHVTLLAPNGDPAGGEVIALPSARLTMRAFREDDPFEHRTGLGLGMMTYSAPPLTYALRLDASAYVLTAIQQHATPDWNSNDLTLHPFALNLTVESDGRRHHFTFPRLDFYGDPGDRDPWWRARPNPRWTTGRPTGAHDDVTYWFVMERDSADVPVTVSG